MPLPWGFTAYMKIAVDACVACRETKEGKTEPELIQQEDELRHEITNIMINLEKAYKDKKYILLRSIVAIHRETGRLHGHIRHLINWTGKTVSGWNSKIRREVLEGLVSSSFTLKTTVYSEYDAKFSEQDLWTYGLKEIDSFEKIEFRELFVNMPDEALEQYREIGHRRYLVACKENERTQQRKEQQISEAQEIYNYITTHYEPSETMLASADFRRVKTLILYYYKEKQQNTGQIKPFRVSSIRDLAINYLLTQTDTRPVDIADII